MADETQLTAENFKGEKKMLSIDNIIVFSDLQSRADLDAVKKFTPDIVEAIHDKEEIEPILVIEIGEGAVRKADGAAIKAGNYVCEGFRRLAGHKAAGRDKINCIVRKGTIEDAMDVSTSANIKNLALPRSREDKARAVETCLITHFDWSDRRIADHCHVSGELVAKKRPAAEKYLKAFQKDLPNGQPLDTKTRVGKGGKRQAAKKARKVKEKIDWSEYEGPLGRLKRFVDDVGEKTLTEDERKKDGSDFQKAHTILKALGMRLKAWSAKKPKVIA